MKVDHHAIDVLLLAECVMVIHQWQLLLEPAHVDHLIITLQMAPLGPFHH